MQTKNSDFNDNFMRASVTTPFIETGSSAAQAMVVENVVVSVTEGMSSKNKDIVMDCVQFATTRAGNARKSIEWYERFTNELSICGFPSTRSRFGTYRAKGSRLTMDKLGLEILASLIASAAVGPLTGQLLLGLAATTFEKLKAAEKPLELFQSSSRPWDDVSYAIVAGTETAEGDVLLAMAVVTIDAKVDVTNVLFWDFNTSSVSIERGEDIKQLNRRQWRRAERHVDEYLAGNITAHFERFNIA